MPGRQLIVDLAFFHFFFSSFLNRRIHTFTKLLTDLGNLNV